MVKTLRAVLIGWLIASALPQTAPPVLAQTGRPDAAVKITDAWARATPGKAVNGAAYLTLVAPAADRLVAISTPVAGKAELHTMTMEGSVMRMRPLAALDLPAGQAVTLKPGAVHIMLQGLHEPLRAGQSFPLTLTFEKAGTQQVAVAIETIGATGAAGPAGGADMATPAHRMPKQH
jgi:copper(I)-binding protein